ncbi:MAG: hypothetical protein PHN16_05285 [Candidatus Omnitrophica bacterium]|nr:hypothetical protein [Candidatus Omnitrophota bacterium]
MGSKNIKKSKKIQKKPLKKSKKTALKKKPAKKKIIVKKPAKNRPTLKKQTKNKLPREGVLIGTVTHYFPHVQAAAVKLKAPLSKGDNIKIKGHTTDIKQTVVSLQIDRVDIKTAKKGDLIGLRVNSRVRQQDKIYKI